MILKQISVFLENKQGQLSELIRFFADKEIDLDAISLSEGLDYGLIRVIVDDADAVAVMLKKEDWLCKVTQVLAVTVPDQPGGLKKILSTLSDNGENISYTYSMVSHREDMARLILRVDDIDRAAGLLAEAGIEID